MSHGMESKARDNCTTLSTSLNDTRFCQLSVYVDDYLDNVFVQEIFFKVGRYLFSLNQVVSNKETE